MKKFLKSAALACWGIGYAVRSERHMIFHLIAALLACGLAVAAKLSPLEWIVLIMMISLVIGAELINTAIEHAVDLASPDKHPFAKIAKDVAAGAVLFFAFAAIITGVILFGPFFWSLVKG